MTLLYIAGRLDEIHCIINLITFFILLPICVCLFYRIAEIRDYEDNKDIKFKRYKKYLKKGLIYFITLVFINIILPNQKGVYVLLGTHYLKTNALPEKIMNIINNKLDSILEEERKEEKV